MPHLRHPLFFINSYELISIMSNQKFNRRRFGFIAVIIFLITLLSLYTTFFDSGNRHGDDDLCSFVNIAYSLLRFPSHPFLGFIFSFTDEEIVSSLSEILFIPGLIFNSALYSFCIELLMNKIMLKINSYFL
jgi:hypothetical protein